MPLNKQTNKTLPILPRDLDSGLRMDLQLVCNFLCPDIHHQLRADNTIEINISSLIPVYHVVFALLSSCSMHKWGRFQLSFMRK